MFYQKLTKYLLYAAVFLGPLFWLAPEGLFAGIIALALGFYLVAVSKSQKINLSEMSFIDYALIAFSLVFLVSSLLSLNRYTSLWSFAYFLALVVFYFLARWNLDSKETKKLAGCLVLAGVFSGAMFLLNSFKLVAFVANPLASQSALAAFLGLLTALALYFIARPLKKSALLLYLLASGFFIGLISLINFRIGWIVLTITSFVSLVVLINQKDKVRRWLPVPMFILILSVLWQFFNFSLPYSLNLPGEVSLSQGTSFSIARQVTHSNLKNIVFGSGPDTFQYVFSRFRPLDFNQNPLWQIRFSRAYNQFFESLTTTGYLGFLTFLGLIFSGLTLSVFQARQRLLLAAWLGLTIVAWQTTFSLAFWLFLLVLLLLVSPKKSSLPREFSLGKTSTRSLLSSFAFVLGIVSVALFFGFLSRVYWGEFQFRKGNYQAAVETNPGQAVYHSVWAQESILKAIRLAQELVPEAKPEIQEKKQGEIRNLLMLSINQSEEAVRRSPFDANLWQIRGSVLREAAKFSAPKDKFALDANEIVVKSLARAIELEPNNPMLYLDLGLAYEAQNQKAKAIDAIKKSISLKDNLAISRYELGRVYYNQEQVKLASEELEKAVGFNPNYANALYSLSLALEKLGRKSEALAAMEKVLTLNPENAEVKKRVEALSPDLTGEQKKGDESQAEKE